jgi:hypothetical protein
VKNISEDITDLSFSRLLQKTLYTSLFQSQQLVSALGQEEIRSLIISASALNQFSPLLLSRRPGIEYVSGLPLKLASLVPSTSATQLATAILVEMDGPDQAADLPISQPGYLPKQAIEVQCLSSGQISLRPKSEAIYHWLWSFCQIAPTVHHIWSPREAARQLSYPLPMRDSRAGHLKLSPLVYIQYCHARCCQVLTQGTNTGRGELLETYVDPLDKALLPSLEAGDIAVVKAVIGVIDQLIDQPLPAHTLLNLSYGLAETTDLWLRGQGNLIYLPIDKRWVLQTAQVALGSLLSYGLGSHAPHSF